MSTIFYDPTEARPNTRLPTNVIKIARPLNGLERVTGADILVTITKFKHDDLSPLAKLNGEIFNSRPPGEIAKEYSVPLPVVLLGKSFKQAVASGVLIQRKTGTDLTSSIQKLPHILLKMQKWSNRPMLLFAGNRYTKSGKVYIDGTETNCSFAQLEGAITSWTLSGGYFREVTYDREVKGFLSHWLNWLQKMEHEPEKELPPRAVQRPIIENVLMKDKPWIATIMSIPGWGTKKSCTLGEMSGNLTDALTWVTEPKWLEKVCHSRPNCIKISDVVKMREWFGFDEPNLQITTSYYKIDDCPVSLNTQPENLQTNYEKGLKEQNND